jgi:hypothetical protein
MAIDLGSRLCIPVALPEPTPNGCFGTILPSRAIMVVSISRKFFISISFQRLMTSTDEPQGMAWGDTSMDAAT